MSEKSSLLTMLLLLVWIVSSGQGILLTRFQAEQVVKDRLRLDECDSVQIQNERLISNLNDQVGAQVGKVILLEGKVAEFERVEIPALKLEIKNKDSQNEIVEEKLRNKNFWSIVKDALIVLLAAEVVKLSLK